MSCPILVRFSNDMRLDDHEALSEAVKKGAPIIPFYIDTVYTKLKKPSYWVDIGSAQKWWMHHALVNLQKELRDLGSDLVIRRGDPDTVIDALIRETGACAVYWNRRYEPHTMAFDITLKERLGSTGIVWQSMQGNVLIEPWQLLNGSGTPYKVFTPFWKACLAYFQERRVKRPIPAPKVVLSPARWPDSLTVEDLHYLPDTPDWAADTLAPVWQGRISHDAAMTRLHDFIADGLPHYSGGRDLPAQDFVSQLSPYLATGCISPRHIWAMVHDAMDRGDIAPAHHNHAEHFLREVGWREFSYYLLYHFPHITDKPLNAKFTHFPWQSERAIQETWQRGMTGYPVIDAGMRQLWQTGWMHNRVRMIVASFFTKNLLQPWQDGAAWFWDTLVDADLASNAASWQWVAGSGADAAPYFRIFNPVIQSKKFYTDGAYIRRYVPELAALPDAHIHEPYAAPESVLREAGIVLGTHYPRPMVDLQVTRTRALEAMKQATAEADA